MKIEYTSLMKFENNGYFLITPRIVEEEYEVLKRFMMVVMILIH